MIAHLLITALLFFLAGPDCVLYALLVTVYELVYPSPRHYLVLLVLVEACLAGLLSVSLGVCGEYRHVFLPDRYYHSQLIPKSVIYYSWASLLLMELLACFLQKRKATSRKRLLIGQAARLIILAALCLWGIPAYNDSKSGKIKELDYYSRTEQWDKILKSCQGPLSNYLYISHVNLALMQKGELGDRLFTYDQRGPEGLITSWNKTTSVSVLLSDIYFAMNLIVRAQEMAFEASISVIGEANPRMMKRLVQTNLIYGAYPVAEKYISLLEQTFSYRKWAAAHRRFLYNDTGVENDPLLGAKRKALKQHSTLSMTEGLDMELRRLADDNPSDRTSIVYVGTLYLLLKDVALFQTLVEQYFDTPALPELPVSFQEAVILMKENDPAYWRRFRVSEQVARRFAEYKKQTLAANRSGNSTALRGLLQRAFGDTYWFYFMFK
jgi:hypothetical protein